MIGGTTPAALAADWLTSALDQNAGAWVGLAACQPPREHLHRLAARPVRAAARVWRRPGDRRHDGQLHLPGGRAATGAGSDVGKRIAGSGTGEHPADPGFLERVHPRERDQVAGDARDRRRQRAQADPGRGGPPRPRRTGARPRRAGGRPRDRRRQRRRGECGRLRPHRRDGGPGPGPWRLAPRRRRLRTVRAVVAEVGPPRCRRRACPVRLLRRPQVAERAPRLRIRLPARAGAPQRNLRRGGGLPSLSRRSPAELGLHGTGGITPSARLRDLGNAAGLRAPAATARWWSATSS